MHTLFVMQQIWSAYVRDLAAPKIWHAQWIIIIRRNPWNTVVVVDGFCSWMWESVVSCRVVEGGLYPVSSDM